MTDNTLIIMLSLLIISLVVAGVLNIRHQQVMKKKKEIAKLRGNAQTIIDACQISHPYIEDGSVAKTLGQYALSVLQSVQSLDPADPHTQSALANAQQLNEILKQPKEEQFELPANSTLLKHIQTSMLTLITTLQKMAKAGKLDAKTQEQMVTETKWGMVKVEVLIYLAEGDKLAEKGDNYHASGYYKRALTCLKSSGLNDPRKTQHVKLVNTAIENLDKPKSGSSATGTEGDAS